jgi:hypothetical protein
MWHYHSVNLSCLIPHAMTCQWLRWKVLCTIVLLSHPLLKVGSHKEIRALSLAAIIDPRLGFYPGNVRYRIIAYRFDSMT